MPIYEYACAACSHQFEEWQKIKDKPVKTCPKCKAKKVERLISQTSFHLKGGGWYSDLYSAPKPKSSTSDEGGASKDSPSKEAAPASPSTVTETKTKKTEAAPSGGRPTTSKREKKQ